MSPESGSNQPSLNTEVENDLDLDNGTDFESSSSTEPATKPFFLVTLWQRLNLNEQIAALLSLIVLLLLLAGAVFLISNRYESLQSLVDQNRQDEPSTISSPSPVATPKSSPTPSLTPTQGATTSASPKATSSASISPSPSPTTFDLNLENILFSHSPEPANPEHSGVINARSQSEFTFARQTSAQSITLIVRNNGHEPAEKVTYEVIIDDKSIRFVKDRIDQQTSHSERVIELPDENKKHSVRVNIFSDKPESNVENNSYNFTYQYQ